MLVVSVPNLQLDLSCSATNLKSSLQRKTHYFPCTLMLGSHGFVAWNIEKIKSQCGVELNLLIRAEALTTNVHNTRTFTGAYFKLSSTQWPEDLKS